MEVESKEELTEFLSTLDFTEESIKKASDRMLKISKDGHAKECIQIWKDHETQIKTIGKLALYYVLHDTLIRFAEDDMGLLKEIPEVLNEIFMKSLIECPEKEFRCAVASLVQAWKQNQIYSADYLGFLEHWLKEADAKYPVKKEILDAGIPFKVKSFAVYLNNYNLSKDKLKDLELQIITSKESGQTASPAFKKQVEDFEKTLYSMRIQRNGLLRSIYALTTDFRQNLSMRLHKIQELEDLKGKLASTIADPEPFEAQASICD